MPWGDWKSLQEMEDTLTLEELYLIVDAQHRAEHRHNKFMAAIQGVDIDEGKADESFDRVKQRAEAALAGKSEEEHVLDIIGIAYEDDD